MSIVFIPFVVEAVLSLMALVGLILMSFAAATSSCIARSKDLSPTRYAIGEAAHGFLDFHSSPRTPCEARGDYSAGARPRLRRPLPL